MSRNCFNPNGVNLHPIYILHAEVGTLIVKGGAVDTTHSASHWEETVLLAQTGDAEAFGVIERHCSKVK